MRKVYFEKKKKKPFGFDLIITYRYNYCTAGLRIYSRRDTRTATDIYFAAVDRRLRTMNPVRRLRSFQSCERYCYSSVMNFGYNIMSGNKSYSEKNRLKTKTFVRHAVSTSLRRSLRLASLRII